MPNPHHTRIDPLGRFDPRKVAGMQLWLRADVPGSLYQDSGFTTLAVADADPVGGWQDQSGKTNHVIQATSSKRGSLKLAIQRGLPVVRFDGVDDLLANAGFNAFVSQTGYTAFLVAKPANVTANQVAVAVGPNTERPYWHQVTGSELDIAAGTAVNQFGAVTSLVWSAFQIHSVVYDGSQATNATRLKLYRNGVQTTFNSFTGTIPAALSTGTGVQIGGTSDAARTWTADIGEVLLYAGVLSDANRQHIERDWLNRRWGTF